MGNTRLAAAAARLVASHPSAGARCWAITPCLARPPPSASARCFGARAAAGKQSEGGATGRQGAAPGEEIPVTVPKPYTVPEGYMPPTPAECWGYAMKHHPYARSASAGALLFGLLAWGANSVFKEGSPSTEPTGTESPD
mmetsp:Transcript_25679/g.66098  ORF Transcript_25679/g.66098 Transcript_25679/m.66098 type:complete len:140 (-) Transcript_25679:294-713(-)